ncbi:MAG: AAA family ATPase [Saprospiraceae bacterium]|nr:AAA family ATPase [Saprospiraceae bacterium]
MKTVLTNKEYNLPYWGISSYEKFLSKIFPNYFIRFNKKYRTVADYVNLDYKSDGEVWEQYASFQKEIAKPCFELYTNLNYNNSKEVSESTLINDFFEFIYETKIKDDEIDMDLEFIVNIHTQLKKISIQNYYCIKDIDLPKLTNEVYIVGENGVGKTLLLQAIFWAIQYPLIENDPENTLGTAWIKRNFNQLENLNIEIETNEVG